MTQQLSILKAETQLSQKGNRGASNQFKLKSFNKLQVYFTFLKYFTCKHHTGRGELHSPLTADVIDNGNSHRHVSTQVVQHKRTHNKTLYHGLALVCCYSAFANSS